MPRSAADIIRTHIRSGKARLPVMSRTAQKLQEMLDAGELEIDAIEDLAEEDPLFGGAILELSNSPLYAGLDKVTNVHEAIMRLGSVQIARLGSIVAHKSNFSVRSARLRAPLRALWVHAVTAAAGCQWLVEELKRQDLASEAFRLGMVHDLGRLMILRSADDLVGRRPNFSPSPAEILELMEADHVDAGVGIVEGWGFSDEALQAVERHHAEPAEGDEFLTSVLRVVDRGCRKLGIGLPPEAIDWEQDIDVERLGLRASQLEELEERLGAAIELADAG